ncbi:PhoU domain-containing protein [Deinococcus sp.]|uniref:PhoU domain-containing protein n=1 Tax=Deinococcus sp. TaxID=47478 RepID=UPI0025BB71FA|nr:PhoU domain-containing protein [Deinococcus sp.]
MTARLDEQLGAVRGQFLTMQDHLVSQLRLLGDPNRDPAQVQADVQALDLQIDAAEQAAVQGVLRLLALQSPVARDLRLTVLILQSTPDLERAGDYARHLARTPGAAGPEGTLVLGDLTLMAATLRAATLPGDAGLAAQVRELDARVDARFEAAMTNLIGQPGGPGALSAAAWWRSAERLGDHLKNVAVRLEDLYA